MQQKQNNPLGFYFIGRRVHCILIYNYTNNAQ
jgi:hypothetical protein